MRVGRAATEAGIADKLLHAVGELAVDAAGLVGFVPRVAGVNLDDVEASGFSKQASAGAFADARRTGEQNGVLGRVAGFGRFLVR